MRHSSIYKDLSPSSNVFISDLNDGPPDKTWPKLELIEVINIDMGPIIKVNLTLWIQNNKFLP